MTTIRITCDGKLALTTAQAADRHGLELATMRQIIKRANLEPAAMLDNRTPLYLAGQIDHAVSARPGRGANLNLRAATPSKRR